MSLKIILASTSPRRKQLLEWAEVDFEIITHPTDELIPEGVPAAEVPVIIAREKALAVKEKLLVWSEGHTMENASHPILAADTIVVLGNEILGKPKDREQAIEMLMKLQGNHHKVITGVVILYNGKEIAFSDTTDVVFHPLTHDQIAFYVDRHHPYDKAGAYAIQEWIGVVGIKSVNGDFFNVMGLPVSRVVRAINTL
ncbi:MAG: Maf family protein [Chitinophagaceae bacterium]